MTPVFTGRVREHGPWTRVVCIRSISVTEVDFDCVDEGCTIVLSRPPSCLTGRRKGTVSCRRNSRSERRRGSWHTAHRCTTTSSRSDASLKRRGIVYVYIGVGDAGDASPTIFCQPGTKCLISPPKFVKIVVKLPAERCSQRLRYKQDTQTFKERVIVLILYELYCHPLCTFRLCLHVGINAWWGSVTYFLLGLYSFPPMFSYCRRRCMCKSKTLHGALAEGKERAVYNEVIVKIPPHLTRVATLPCEICGSFLTKWPRARFLHRYAMYRSYFFCENGKPCDVIGIWRCSHALSHAPKILLLY